MTMDRIPLRSSRTYYNTFYALRISARIREQPVELIHGKKSPRLSCGTFKSSPLFRPVLDKLFQLLAPYGVAGFERCFSDPCPIIETSLEDKDTSVLNILQSLEAISFQVWLTFFRALSVDSVEADGGNPASPAAYRAGSSCQIDLLFLSPNHYRKEVEIIPVSLANREHIEDLATSSMVFDFSSAMLKFLSEPSAGKAKENIELSELEAELSEVSNWFHLGMVLELPETQLLKILMGCRHAEPCRVQVLGMWMEGQSKRDDMQQTSWSVLTGAVAAAGRKSIARHIAKKYCVSLAAGGSSPTSASTAKRKLSRLEAILSELEFSDLQEDFEERDHELIEKGKTLESYGKEKKFMDLSVVQLTNAFEAAAEEVTKLIEEKTSLGERLHTLRNEILAIESALELNEPECEPKNDGAICATHRLGERLGRLQTQMKTFRDMKSEREKNAREVMNDLKKNEKQLEDLKTRVLKMRDVLVQETTQLSSKSQQIHQLKRIISQIQARIKTNSCSLDRLLQQKVAARNKPQPPVFQLQIDVAKEELIQHEQQLKALGRSMDTAGEVITKTRELLQNREVSINSLLAAVTSAEKTRVERERSLVELLHLVQEWIQLKEKLLQEKEDKWQLERDTWAVNSNMSRLREFIASVTRKDDPAPTQNGVVESDSESSLEECTIVPRETTEVNINRSTRFSLIHEDKSKINPKKNMFTAELHSIVNGSIISSTVGVKATKPVTFTTIFCPTVRGRHFLHIKMNGSPVRGSPYPIYVKLNPTSLGEVVRELKGYEYPYAAAVTTKSTHLVVSECRKCMISITDLVTGRKIKMFGNNGKSQLKIPNGIAIDQNGFMFITDSGNHQILKFSPEGTHMTSIGTKGEKTGQFQFPYGAKLSPSNDLYVCDHNNFRIQVFTPDLKYSYAVSTSSPYDVTFDRKGKMYTTDRKHHIVRVYENYKCTKEIGTQGSRGGELLEPRGICIDRLGFVYVVEEANCRVSVFNTAGKFITCFGGEGHQPGEFDSPQGIAIDDDGFLYVCDMLNNRIQVF